MKKMIEKWCGLPESVKSTVAFVVSSFLLKGVVFLTTPIFTRIMDATQYGFISNFQSWMVIIEVFALIGLTSAGVFNVGLNDYSTSRDSYVASVLVLCNCVTTVIFAGLFCFGHFSADTFMLPYHQLVLMFLWLWFSPAQIFWITRKKYEYKYKLAFVVVIASTVVSQAVALLAVKYVPSQWAADAKLWGQYGAGILFALPIYIYILLRGKNGFRFSYWKHVLIFALPLIPHYLAQHIMSSADRIMIAQMVSTAELAIYSVVHNISQIALLVWNAINASLIAYTFESINQKKYDGLRQVVNTLLVGYSVVCVVVALLAPDVMKLLAPDEYYMGVYAVPPVIVVAFLSALYNVYANVEFYYKKSYYITCATIVASATNVVLNVFLIPKFSFIGASYTTFISYLILVLMHYLGYKKCTSDSIYNNRMIFCVTAGCIVICLMCSILYTNSVIRYALIAFILFFCVWKRKLLIQSVKKMRK